MNIIHLIFRSFQDILRNSMLCILFLILLMLQSNYVQSQLQPIEHYLAQLPKGSDLSLLIQSVDEQPKTLIQYQADHFKLPASTQKIITALAAELQLGSEYQFKTKMLTNGSINKKTLYGDLVIQMSGDPSFSRLNLSDMLAMLKLRGIEKIYGDIIINTSIFDSHDKASGWSWNNLTACYNTSPTAVIVDNNCFYAGILPATKIGEQATTSVASIYPITITSNIKTIEKGSTAIEDKYCELDVITSENNHYHLTGCIEQSSTNPKNNKKLYLRFAVQNGVDYFANILKSQLQDKQIKLTGKIVETKSAIEQNLTVLAINQSEPLSVLLTNMLKNSDNLIADILFRTLGAHYYSTETTPIAGTWRNGSDAVKAILQEKAGIDLSDAVIADGSGLSRVNLINTEKMMQILQYIAANNEQLHMIEMLPISGVDGTLKFRKSLAGNALKNYVHAKTGYLEGNHNLAGFIQIAENHYLAFVQFVSGYHYVPEDETEKANTPLTQFEEALYHDLISK